jgi:hypothetical protein
MSAKIWKIFGILGMVFVSILIFWFFAQFFTYRLQSLSVFDYGEQFSSYKKELQIANPIKSKEISFERSGAETSFQSHKDIVSRLVIKSGWLNLVVKDVLDVAKKIAKFAEENGGWVVSSNISEQEKVPSGSITVRVPAEKFDEAKEYFRGLAVRVAEESVQAQDITEEYVDLRSRLKNLEAAETQLLELMKRSGTINDILQVQRELTNVRGQIEQIKGRMQYLEQSVKMSSITVNLALSEELLPIPPAEKWRPKYVWLQAWKNVLTFWKEFSYFLIRLTVWAQVWVPLLVIVVLVIRKIKKKKQ